MFYNFNRMMSRVLFLTSADKPVYTNFALALSKDKYHRRYEDMPWTPAGITFFVAVAALEVFLLVFLFCFNFSSFTLN